MSARLGHLAGLLGEARPAGAALRPQHRPFGPELPVVAPGWPGSLESGSPEAAADAPPRPSPAAPPPEGTTRDAARAAGEPGTLRPAPRERGTPMPVAPEATLGDAPVMPPAESAAAPAESPEPPAAPRLDPLPAIPSLDQVLRALPAWAARPAGPAGPVPPPGQDSAGAPSPWGQAAPRPAVSASAREPGLAGPAAGAVPAPAPAPPRASATAPAESPAPPPGRSRPGPGGPAARPPELPDRHRRTAPPVLGPELTGGPVIPLLRPAGESGPGAADGLGAPAAATRTAGRDRPGPARAGSRVPTVSIGTIEVTVVPPPAPPAAGDGQAGFPVAAPAGPAPAAGVRRAADGLRLRERAWYGMAQT